jgi:hypothetical protein
MTDQAEPSGPTSQGGNAVSAPSAHPFQLNGEDYENIWLRIKDRYWKRIFASLALSATLGGLGGYAVAERFMDRAVKDAVKEYAQTEEFKTKIAQATREQVPSLQSAMIALEQRETQLGQNLAARQQTIAAMESGLVKITEHSIVLTTTDGQKLHIEYGRTAANQMSDVPVKFEAPFTRPPAVFLTLIDGEPTRSSLPLSATKISLEGFSVATYTGGFLPAKMDWIAIGH